MAAQKRVHIKSITSGEYLDQIRQCIDPNNTECLIAKGKVTTLICKEIASDFDIEDAHDICKSLNTETSHIWKTEDM